MAKRESAPEAKKGFEQVIGAAAAVFVGLLALKGAGDILRPPR